MGSRFGFGESVSVVDWTRTASNQEGGYISKTKGTGLREVEDINNKMKGRRTSWCCAHEGQSLTGDGRSTGQHRSRKCACQKSPTGDAWERVFYSKETRRWKNPREGSKLICIKAGIRTKGSAG